MLLNLFSRWYYCIVFRLLASLSRVLHIHHLVIVTAPLPLHPLRKRHRNWIIIIEWIPQSLARRQTSTLKAEEASFLSTQAEELST